MFIFVSLYDLFLSVLYQFRVVPKIRQNPLPFNSWSVKALSRAICVESVVLFWYPRPGLHMQDPDHVVPR